MKKVFHSALSLFILSYYLNKMVFTYAEFVENFHNELSEKHEKYAVKDTPYLRVSLLRSVRFCFVIFLKDDVKSVVNLLLVSVLHDVDDLPDPVVSAPLTCG